MDRREFLKKLGKYSIVVGGLTVLGANSQGCLYDDYGDYSDYADYGDAYGDSYDDGPYADSYDDGPYADYGDAYGDAYGDYPDYTDS